MDGLSNARISGNPSASSIAVRPFLSFNEGLAPDDSNILINSILPLIAALLKAISPLLFTGTFGSAPALSSNLITSLNM
ncbi:hypothetical protein D3C73_1439000 [compost metagenome]